MIRNNKFRKKLIRRVPNRNNNLNRSGNLLNKILIQFVISCIIVLLAFGIKVNFLNGKKYLNTVKYVLEYNMDFKEYSTIVHKKVTEVLNIYDKGEFR